MKSIASGTFDVELTPRAAGEGEDATPGRMLINKRYQRDLEGTGRGQMLTALTEVQGSAGYVAIEVVSGTLAGRTGTFILQHSGIMAHGRQNLFITVVPDSGTGDFAGITGTMSIRIENGQHFYELEYELPGGS